MENKMTFHAEPLYKRCSSTSTLHQLFAHKKKPLKQTA
ncbi:hypothetical protein SD78_4301 [Bacillus badius]|nr:hypothetical protein SD78_4301 [Bacillus badius]